MHTGSPADGEQASPGSDGIAVEYLRKLEESLRYWYSAAENKAQVVLTLNGVFLAFVTGAILTNGDKAALTVSVFGPETWVFLAGMALGVAGSVFCAVTCLVPRGLRREPASQGTAHPKGESARAGRLQPENALFFADLARLEPDDFVSEMLSLKPQFVVRALARDQIEWSRQILTKHRWVNGAFILTGVTLGFFLCTGVSYLIRVDLAA